MTKTKVIAIDGPCGSGKSSVAQVVAKRLKVLYVDTGAMFRALGYVCKKENIAILDNDEMNSFLKKINFKYGVDEKVLVEIDGVDLTEKIREHYVSDLASKISKLSSVREYLKEVQQHLPDEKICVMEGRDIGTVIFPKSFCKIFLTADVEIRAKRRLDQLVEKGQTDLKLEQVLVDIKVRDQNDTTRKVAPLKQAEDAYLLDSSLLTFEQVIDRIEHYSKEQARDEGISI